MNYNNTFILLLNTKKKASVRVCSPLLIERMFV